MGYPSRIGREKLKRFFRHICIVIKRYNEREAAGISLKKQISKIKKGSKHTHKGRVEKEFNRLEQRIHDVLDKESKISMLGKKEPAAVRELRARLKLLEHELSATKKSRDIQLLENKSKIEKLNRQLTGLKSEVKSLIELKSARHRRMEELEKKIRAVSRPANASLKLKIESLESRSKELIGRTSNKEDLAAIQEKLDAIKKAL